MILPRLRVAGDSQDSNGRDVWRNDFASGSPPPRISSSHETRCAVLAYVTQATQDDELARYFLTRG